MAWRRPPPRGTGCQPGPQAGRPGQLPCDRRIEATLELRLPASGDRYRPMRSLQGVPTNVVPPPASRAPERDHDVRARPQRGRTRRRRAAVAARKTAARPAPIPSHAMSCHSRGSTSRDWRTSWRTPYPAHRNSANSRAAGRTPPPTRQTTTATPRVSTKYEPKCLVQSCSPSSTRSAPGERPTRDVTRSRKAAARMQVAHWRNETDRARRRVTSYPSRSGVSDTHAYRLARSAARWRAQSGKLMPWLVAPHPALASGGSGVGVCWRTAVRGDEPLDLRSPNPRTGTRLGARAWYHRQVSGTPSRCKISANPERAQYSDSQ